MKKPSKRKPKSARSRKSVGAQAPAAKVTRLPPAAVQRTGGREPLRVRAPSGAKRAPEGVLAAAFSAYGDDDRRTLMLMMLPVVLMALAIGAGHVTRPASRPFELARPAPPALPAGQNTAANASLRSELAAQSPARRVAAPVATGRVALRADAVVIATETPRAIAARSASPAVVAPNNEFPSPVTAITLEPQPMREAVLGAPELPASPHVLRETVAAAASPGSIPSAQGTAGRALHADLPAAAPTEIPRVEIALAAPRLPPAAAVPDLELPLVPDAEPGKAAPGNVCVFEPKAAQSRIEAPRDPESFGRELAAAAKSQTREFVVYNDKYRRIAYPMGDVPSFYGVCTDVIIRAYRALGIDLQALVQTTRTGSGDPNIDHRRVDTLRRFFAAHGQSLPVTDFAENYRPGDVVSYWRPQNRHSRTHIAIVANEIGPSGRPMIIHNRGWGPQIEDGLFVDQITGHYRFTGLKGGAAKPTASAPAAPSPRREAGIAVRKATP